MYPYTDQENEGVNHYTHKVINIYTGPITVIKLALYSTYMCCTLVTYYILIVALYD